MSATTAIIVGVEGQDGTLLWEHLKSKGYRIIGISQEKDIYHGIEGVEISTNILNIEQVEVLIRKYMPHELYYFAAYHHSSQEVLPSDSIVFKRSTEIHVDGYFNILQAIVKYSPNTKICYASSCLIFEGTSTQEQNEETLPVPHSPYAITKLEGMHVGEWFMKKYGISIVNAILYNHESEFRAPKFLSKKIILGAINISRGLQETITLGDISAQIDQGYAQDYIEAMHLLLQKGKSGNYIISSGELHTIQDLVEIAFDQLHLDWKKHVLIDPNILQRKTGILFGNNRKIFEETGWVPKTGFREMIISILQKSL